MPTVEEFKTELHRMTLEAVKAGNGTVDINSAELHRRVGDYPDANRHRMPVCCEVMKAALAPDAGDKVLQEPPSGSGASLTIRYVLNFIKIHRTLRVSPAMAAGVTDRLWSVEDLVALWEAYEQRRAETAA